MDNSLIPRAFSPTDAKREREANAREAERRSSQRPSHTHPGTEVTSQVAAAAQADGSQYGFTNNVAGSQFYALWVGNDGGFHFGRNTSSIQYKENVRTHDTDPAKVLALQPVI